MPQRMTMHRPIIRRNDQPILLTHNAINAELFKGKWTYQKPWGTSNHNFDTMEVDVNETFLVVNCAGHQYIPQQPSGR